MSDKHNRYYKYNKFRQNPRSDPKIRVDMTWNDPHLAFCTGSVKANNVDSRISSAISQHKFMFVLLLQLKKEGTSLSLSYLWLCHVNNGLKSCQSYNRLPARMKNATGNYDRISKLGHYKRTNVRLLDYPSFMVLYTKLL